MPTNIYIFEGSWDRPTEAPQVLPYLQAYEHTYRDVHVHHRSIRNTEDLRYYMSRIPKNDRSFVYVASHAENDYLDPSPPNKAGRIDFDSLIGCVEDVKENAIGFLHFGCCHFLSAQDESRRKRLTRILEASPGIVFVSGYTKEVEWLPSMLLDVAFTAQVYVPWQKKPTERAAAENQAREFLKQYETLVRSLGFSAISGLRTQQALLPARL